MSETETTAPEAPAGSVDQSAGVESGSAVSETVSDSKAPKLDGPVDTDRLLKLVENLRSENATVKSKLQEREDAEKSEMQKAAERAERAEQELKTLRRDSMVAGIAKEKKVPEELIGFLTADTEDEIRAQADKLSAHVKTTGDSGDTGTKPRVKPVSGNGADFDNPTQLTESDLEGMSNTEIVEARKAGRLDSLLGKR